MSLLPRGDAIHYWVQRHLTRTLPRSAAAHESVLGHARRFSGFLSSHLREPLSACAVLEFGAGRDLGLALALSELGVGRVIATDLEPLAKLDLIQVAASRLSPRHQAVKSLAALAEAGIEYRAPFDVRNTGLPEASLNGIVSSEVMEHIPATDLQAIVGEAYRILRAGGLAIMKIDYSDHYARGTATATRFNFLTYSDEDWKRYDCRFQHVNRLRHSDYLRLFRNAGFDIVQAETNPVPPIDEVVRKLADRFRSYALEDLFLQNATIVARKL
jgi:SAM-dependent methyltransferase